MKRFQKILLCVLMIGAIITAITSGFILFNSYRTEFENNKAYEDLSLEYKVPISSMNDKDSVITESSQQLYNFDELSKTNFDIRGWVTIPNSLIDFPVVQGRDNSHYLSYDFNNNYNENGCPFLDYRTTPSSQSITVHGHNMGTGKTSMFSTLIKYDDKTYYDSHKYIYYSSSEDKKTINEYQIFSVIHFNINDLSNFDYMQREFNNIKDINDFIIKAKERSIYDTGYFPKVNDLSARQIIVLSTCDMRTYGSNGRYIIVAYKKH